VAQHATSTVCAIRATEKEDQEKMTSKKAARKTAKMAKPAPKKTNDESAVRARIAAMPSPFRAMGERVHALILLSAPSLQPRVWYGMPGYAKAKDSPVICFFRADKKYMTFGFTQAVNVSVEASATHQLIECAWYFSALDNATEAKLCAIVHKVAC